MIQELNLQSLVSLANFTTLRVGGKAEFFAEPNSPNELQLLINWANTEKIPCQVLGAGSNLLVNDTTLQGLSVCTRKLNGAKVNGDNGLVKAFAGEPLPSLSRRAAKEGLHGLEWAIGIPGTLGGAVVMNAGAQGGCMADLLKTLTVMSLREGKQFELKKEDLRYGYRHSRLQEDDLIVISATLQLEAGHNSDEVCRKTNENLIHRTSTQPYSLPNCGSVFRNPEPLKAAQLIDELGLKGYRIGGAEISNIHANFIVNQAAASAKDINDLISFIQCEVEKAYGLKLHPEVKFLGFRSNSND